MNIIGKKYWYFAFSLLIIIPGLISLILWGLNLSIDFTGGSQTTFSFAQKVDQNVVGKVSDAFSKEKIKVYSVETSNNLAIVRTKEVSQAENNKVVSRITNEFKGSKEVELNTVGPTIGGETTANAVKAILIASLLIVLYITWSFRSVPKPTSSFRFGVSAIVSLLHDVLVLIGLFSILGHFFGVQVDSLFVTAVLTVIGFSVHDTIVVFDRIRENLRRTAGLPFEKVVNESILQTLDRSLNTSMTVILVLLALLIFGGETIRWFVVALLIGIVSGTYSSIFNASPLLVLWQEISDRRKSRS